MKSLVVLVAILVVSGCVTTKKKGAEVTKFKKEYHNLTSKYNYWFNADELLTLTMAQLAAQHRDNYNQILEIYPYVAPDPIGSRGDLDNVIKKSSMGIGLHRPSDFVDDCYTMIGQAQFLKRDFETAEATFRYIKEEHDPKRKSSFKKDSKKKKEIKKKKKSSKKKKKKKPSRKKKTAKQKAAEKAKAERKAQKAEAKAKKKQGADATAPVVTGVSPYKQGAKRTAAYPLAMIWFGRTLVAREKYDEAEFLYRELWEDPWFPVELKKDLSLAEASLWMKQKRYDRAIPPLENALTRTRKKSERARLAYILSQLYEQSRQFDKSYEALNIVLRSRPTYEMEFNASLHQIQAAWTNGRNDAAEANRALEKMLKDEKNKEYRDQIYYVMADIALEEKQRNEAISYLRKSLDHNVGNSTQRTESYLKLADLFFEDENFVQAKLYYDSTLTVLPATDERYSRVSNYAKNLTDIARLIETIAANDSIVRIFYMDEDARKELAKTIKKQREEEAKMAAQKEQTKAGDGPAKALPNFAGAGVQPSTFYFYNEAFVKKGKKDFNRVWGSRKLEDNWRRSNRIGTGVEEIAGAAGKSDSTRTGELSEAELTDIFQNIPRSEAELEVLHASTYEAMYQLGTLFRDRLENNRRCSGTLEEMQTRYPDKDKYEKETWYYCYLAFNDLGNQPRANYYLEKLTTKHPNSPYARALSDPNFLNATKERERELNSYYEQTYSIFQNGSYQNAFERCQEAPKKYGSTNPLMPKFALLGALCVGNLQGGEAYCKALSEVIARYPESAESTRAKEIARLLACKGFEVQEISKKNDMGAPLDEAFTLEDDKLHYFLVVITGDVRLDDIKSSISDYNREYHRLEQLRISNIFLGTDTNMPIVVIRKFDNKEQVMRYYNEVNNKKDFLGENDKKSYSKEFFAVTQENYRRILKNRTLDGYRTFFETNYLK